jgi:putative tryptophan/tyrosine transport system substrate-binding protein
MRRRDFIKVIAGSAIAWPLATHAQQPEPMRRIGVLMQYAEGDAEVPSRTSALERSLQKLGWAAGRNLRIDYRFGAGDVERIGTLAAELVALAPDMILTGGFATLTALQQATRTIPIVFVTVTDPVGGGFVQSFARPGGNITGFVPVEPPVAGKWLSVLKELAPNVARVSVMFNPETAPYAAEFLHAAQDAAQSLRVDVTAAAIRTAAEVEATLAALARERGGGLIVMADNAMAVHRKLIIALADRHRIPSIYPYRYYVTDGGLISYGTDQIAEWQQAAAYANAVLRGAKPADLPVQAATKYELVVNLKVAKSLGLDLPLSMLTRIDEMVE